MATAARPKELVTAREGLEDVMKRRFITTPAFSIYGGVAGLYDWGPVGCALKYNLTSNWRQHFVVHEGMLEIESSALTPYPVLETSGHVAKFKDVMVADLKTQDNFRADHLLEEHMDKLLAALPEGAPERNELEIVRAKCGGMDAASLGQLFKQYGVKSPLGNELGEPFDFNLMFATSIGPGARAPGFLRPELAQGMFVNFKRLLDFNSGRMPFACAQIGQAFRNEIAPRAGLLRVREFTLAEIEHFCDPNDKNHPHFREVADQQLALLTASRQEEGESIAEMWRAGDAVSQSVINNETLGYFLCRTFLFLTEMCGIKPQWLRFRQHRRDEMAHYATDCWDAEINCSYGWIECVGHADRACYDLQVHGRKTGIDHSAREEYDVPREMDVVKRTIIKQVIGKTFGKQQKDIVAYLEGLTDDDAWALQEKVKAEGSAVVVVGTAEVKLTSEMIKFEQVKQKVSGRTYTPSVVEPSFGLGRIIYCLLEHAFWTRKDDEQRAVLSFPPVLAPFKVIVLPLSKSEEYEPVIHRISRMLSQHGISHKVDASGAAIGRRYARADEIGIPFGITIDEVTLDKDVEAKFDTVTLRERDSTLQLYGPIDQIVPLIGQLAAGNTTWAEAYEKFPKVMKLEDRQRPSRVAAVAAASS